MPRSDRNSPLSTPIGESKASSPARRQRGPHAKRACVHCKATHVACDDKRPCSRCVSLGIAASCSDCPSKKRGRPRKNKESTPIVHVDNSTDRVQQKDDPLNFDVSDILDVLYKKQPQLPDESTLYYSPVPPQPQPIIQQSYNQNSAIKNSNQLAGNSGTFYQGSSYLTPPSSSTMYHSAVHMAPPPTDFELQEHILTDALCKEVSESVSNLTRMLPVDDVARQLFSGDFAEEIEKALTEISFDLSSDASALNIINT